MSGDFGLYSPLGRGLGSADISVLVCTLRDTPAYTATLTPSPCPILDDLSNIRGWQMTTDELLAGRQVSLRKQVGDLEVIECVYPFTVFLTYSST